MLNTALGRKFGNDPTNGGGGGGILVGVPEADVDAEAVIKIVNHTK